MYFLLFIIITIAVYVVSFKDNFDKENLSKVLTAVIVVGIVILFLAVLGGLANSR